jgi:hypothetical protein
MRASSSPIAFKGVAVVNWSFPWLGPCAHDDVCRPLAQRHGCGLMKHPPNTFQPRNTRGAYREYRLMTSMGQ